MIADALNTTHLLLPGSSRQELRAAVVRAQRSHIAVSIFTAGSITAGVALDISLGSTFLVARGVPVWTAWVDPLVANVAFAVTLLAPLWTRHGRSWWMVQFAALSGLITLGLAVACNVAPTGRRPDWIGAVLCAIGPSVIGMAARMVLQWRHAVAEVMAELEQRIQITPLGKRHTIPAAVRRKVFRRDRYACVQCHATTPLEIDHIYPWSLGGSDRLRNLQTLCGPCNNRKGNRIP